MEEKEKEEKGEKEIKTLDQIKALLKENTLESNHLLQIFFSKEKEKEKETKNIYWWIDRHGENLLHWASAYDNAEMCRFFLNKANNNKIHINLENYKGATPLFYAAASNSLNAVKVLCEHNANPRIRSGYSGLFPFQATQSQDIKDLLLELENRIIPFSPVSLDQRVDYIKKDGWTAEQLYRYRKYMKWLACWNELFSCVSVDDMACFEQDAVDIFQRAGMMGLHEALEDLYAQFLRSLEKNDNEKEKTCAECNCSSSFNIKNQQMFLCTGCREIYFCGKICQKRALRLHKLDCPFFLSQ